MRALIVKELRQLVAWPLALIVTLSAIWIAGFSFDAVLLGLQTNTALAVAAAAAVAGGLFGYLQFTSERRNGTLGYLAHRGGGEHAFFRAKASVGLAAAWFVGFVPPCAFALFGAFGPNGAVIHWGRLLDYALLSSAAVAPYCAAAWTVHLRRGKRELAILLWGAGCLPMMIAVWSASGEAIGLPFAITWLTLEIGVGAGLYALALRAFREGRDRELPLSSAQHVGAIALAALSSLLLVANTGSLFQEWAMGRLTGTYPRIVQDGANGEVFACVRGPDGDLYRADANGAADLARGRCGLEAQFERERTVLVHGPDGRVIDESPPPTLANDGSLRTIFRLNSASLFMSIGRGNFLERGLSIPPPVNKPWGWEILGVDSASFVTPRDRGRFLRIRFFDRDAGIVRVITLDLDVPRLPDQGAFEFALDPPFEHALTRGDGRPFSSQTRYEGERSEDTCFVDLSDRTLWGLKFERGIPVIRALALPNGDELVPQADWPLLERPMGVVFTLRGRAADYRWIDGEFQPRQMYRQGNGSWSTGKPSAPLLPGWTDIDVEITNADALALGVTVVDAHTGMEKFVTTFEPGTLEQRALAVATQLATLIKPPAAVVTSHFLSRTPDGAVASEPSWGRESLVTRGKRPWLVAVVLAWGAFLTIIVVREKRRHGYAPVIVVLSGLLTAIFGVWALVWLSLLDPRRCAARKVEGAVETQPALVIQSA